MIWRYAFSGVGSSGTTSCCPPLHMTVDTIHPMLYTDAPSVHPVLKDSLPAPYCLLLRDHRITAAPPSVHPVLLLQSWHVSVSFRLDHQIDRRCPPMDRRFIQCFWLCCFSSAIHPAHLQNGPSVHLMVPVDSSLYAVYQVLRRSPLGYRRFIRRCLFFLFFMSSTCYCFNLTYLTCHHLCHT
jgi:hypothetical protein